MHIISQAFYERANEVFNPRNAMYISRNNGMLNNEVLPQKDTLVNINTLNDMTLKKYSDSEMDHIRQMKERFVS